MSPHSRWLLLAACVLLNDAPVHAQPAADRPARVDAHGDSLPAGAHARLGTVRFRHGDGICAVRLSPDGKTAASAGGHDLVRLWDLATGRAIRHLDHQSAVAAIAFAADGKVLASAGEGGDVRLWAVTTGRELRRYDVQERVSSLALSRDGNTFAVGGARGTVCVYDVDSGKKLHQFKEGPDDRVGVAFSPDGKTLASWGFESPPCLSSAVRLWDVATWKTVQHFKGIPGWAVAAFSPDGLTLAVGTRRSSDKHLRLKLKYGWYLWEVRTGRKVAEFDEIDGVHDVHFLPDEKHLLLWTYGTLWYCDAATGECLHRLKELFSSYHSVGVTAGGKTVILDSHSHTVRVRELPSGNEHHPSLGGGHRYQIDSVAFSADGKLAVTGDRFANICLWAPATGKEISRFESRFGHAAMALTPDGQMLATGTSFGYVFLFRTPTGKELRWMKGHEGGVRALAFSPDGKTLASGGRDKTVALWDVATGALLRRMSCADQAMGLAFSPDGKSVACTFHYCKSESARLWDVATGRVVQRFQRANSTDYWHGPLAFSPDGKLLASTTPEGEIDIWDVATGKMLRTVKRKRGAFTAVAFSPDGKTLAFALARLRGGPDDRDYRVYLLDVATGKERGRLEGHQGFVTSLVFAPDGGSLLSGSDDATALLWDMTDDAVTGQPR